MQLSVKPNPPREDNSLFRSKVRNSQRSPSSWDTSASHQISILQVADATDATFAEAESAAVAMPMLVWDRSARPTFSLDRTD